ncbi:hypothetical protein GMORB2_4866 [Geosmithia morbida]|uniref:FAD/NAD(P)-binding domain-containing protein n=1 Tax=Geosmithia morbida TaxID=1094350 RepID=A0A9P4YPC2_9HYPO|nr:uncharacterized protein GMORB2_4866 [Geosmithia morbida]KAF4119347.1 hypothetical protein GMORB2_4866 [Geosmithia morbida]
MLSAARTAGKQPFYHSVVVGGGPGGIAVLGNILENAPGQRVLWIDPHFKGGRVNASYREVPSNTKVDLFVKFANAVTPLEQIVRSTAKPNAVTALEALPQDQGCTLGYAADLCLMLSDGIPRQFPTVQQRLGEVADAVLKQGPQGNLWTVGLRGGTSAVTPRLILCTGSHPIPNEKQSDSPDEPEPLHLDVALTPSILARTIDSQAPATVSVVGGSHSAILVLMNLYKLATTSHPHLKVKWFTRHESLRYAVYKDGWILYDNTGLKGQAAAWARENLDKDVFHSSPVSGVVQRFVTPPGEQEQRIYEQELPGSSHVVRAIGYARNPIPKLFSEGADGAAPTPLAVEHDSETGRFFSSPETQTRREHVPGLFGAGIAFPERRVDPYGNVEYAVGFWKFMTFLQKAVPSWLKDD